MKGKPRRASGLPGSPRGDMPPASRDHASPSVDPVAERACPLCGAANHCAPAASGSWTADCWCRRASMHPEALARVPAALRGRACLCPACAEGALPGSAGSAGPPQPETA